ncbi:hypothetical protein [Pseudomonas sp. LFM046]|uniref:hypothetical protein n=1 Tax=Pseudomonas sp. LFM046 TaxID=1608357 RepID=UPI0005CF9883|nr:hypothetical protein [Pseudomonas sp. LFM046]
MNEVPEFEHVALDCLVDEQVEARLEALTQLLAERYCNLRLISQTTKSMVCAGECRASRGQVMVKRYFDARAYAAEVTGYLLFRGGPIAEVLHQDPAFGVIVLRQLSGRFFLPTRSDLMRAVAAYAALHTQALANIRLAFGDRWKPIFVDPCLSASADLAAIDSQGVSVGDGKPEHLIIDDHAVFVIDLETHSLRRSVWFDILFLGRFMGGLDAFSQGLAELVKQYCHCRGLQPSHYDPEKIAAYLQRLWNVGPSQSYREGCAP